MAKTKKRRKSHKKAHRSVTVSAAPKRKRRKAHKAASAAPKRKRHKGKRSGVTLRRIGGFRVPKTRYHIAGTVLSNPLGGFVRLPSMNELIWVGGAALVVPAISNLMKSPANPLPAMMKEGWGGIATELVLASVASVMVRKYVNATAGDAIFILGLANGVQQTVRKVVPVGIQQSLGLTPMQVAVAATPSVGTSYYNPARLGYVDPSQTGGLGEGLPSMV